MKKNILVLLLGVLVFLLGCSIFGNNESSSWQPVLILLPEELPATLASQKMLFYSTRDESINVVSLDRKFQMPLDIQGNYLKLSSDGNYLIYGTSLASLEVQIRLLNLLTGEDLVLFESKDVPGGVMELGISDPSLSPDGGSVLFQYNASSEEFGLGVYSLDDKTIQTVTNAGFNSEPEFSPAGDKILFICEGKKAIGFQICIMDRDGSDRQHLTDAAGGHDAWFSPDGEHIVYQYSTRATLFQPSSESLYVMDINGENVVRLVEGETHLLAFSNDGKDVVYCLFPNEYDTCEGIYVVGLEGKNLRKLGYFDEEFFSQWR